MQGKAWRSVSAPETTVFPDITQTNACMHISHPKPGTGLQASVAEEGDLAEGRSFGDTFISAVR